MRAIEQTTIMITGATDGLGRAVAVDLAPGGATVHLHGRDRLGLQAVRDQIAATTGNDRLHMHVANLASLVQVLTSEDWAAWAQLDLSRRIQAARG
jgi:NADP-dependent 3-hydroxy acid dehydrogenase YdfG